MYVDVEFTLSWDQRIAVIRWVGGISYCCISARHSPPYSDWATGRFPPVPFASLVIGAQFRHRRLLGFEGNRSASTQPDRSITLEIANRNQSRCTQNAPSGSVELSIVSAIAQWNVPPPNPRVRATVVLTQIRRMWRITRPQCPLSEPLKLDPTCSRFGRGAKQFVALDVFPRPP